MTTATEQSITGNEEEQQQEEPGVTIKQLFDFDRVKTNFDSFLLLLYSPLGCFLLIVRLFIFLHLLLLSFILPKESFIRSIVLRYIGFVLGIIVQDDDVRLTNGKVDLLICNRVSDFDPLLVNLVRPSVSLSASYFPRYISWLAGSTVTHSNEPLMNTINNVTPVVCFPEVSHTNGHVGLFQFETWPFSTELTLHFMFINITTPLFNVNICPLGSSWLSNLFWLFFLPATLFDVRYLGSIKRKENESLEEYSKRAQKTMAEHAKLRATNFDLNDLKEMLKRFHTDQRVARRSVGNRANQTNANLESTIESMAIKVKEVLPQVPLATIKVDIKHTKNIDDTIERILSGTVRYTPEPIVKDTNSSVSSGPSTSSGTSSTSSHPIPPGSEAGKLFYAGASSFGKNADERMKSFQERKEHLYRVARARYMQKYGPAATNEQE